jgi:hypothetical protein
LSDADGRDTETLEASVLDVNCQFSAFFKNDHSKNK